MCTGVQCPQKWATGPILSEAVYQPTDFKLRASSEFNVIVFSWSKKAYWLTTEHGTLHLWLWGNWKKENFCSGFAGHSTIFIYTQKAATQNKQYITLLNSVDQMIEFQMWREGAIIIYQILYSINRKLRTKEIMPMAQGHISGKLILWDFVSQNQPL